MNNLITLGSTVATNPLALGSGGNTEYGEVIIQNGGTFAVNKVNVGGPIYNASTNNFITISNNSKMILTNTIASTNQPLDNLTYFTGSVLAMNVDATNLGPYIFVRNFSATGSNQIQIASIKHISQYSAPITLIQFTAGNGSFNTKVLPPGVNGTILQQTNAGVVTISLVVLTNTPKTIAWRNYSGNGNWDLSSVNWLDLNTALHTNFASGDAVVFDDAAVLPTINIADGTDLIPGSISMSNNVNFYQFLDGGLGGQIVGSAPLTKNGTNGLQIDAPTTFNLTVNQGYVIGSGVIGSASLAAGTSLNFTGGIGNGITVAGTANLSSTATGGGTMTVLSGGVVTNAGIWNGDISCATNTVIYNNGTFSTSAPGNVASDYYALVLGANATFVNNGTIHCRTFAVNGKLIDSGLGVIYVFGDVQNGTAGVTIGTGGTFIPAGASATGITTVTSQSPTTFTNAGRLLLSQGSTNVFYVDNSVPTSGQVFTRVMGWGPNQSLPAYNGATLIISNISMTPFSAGETLQIAQSDIDGINIHDAGLNTTNAYPIIIPTTPGPGLAWDLTQIIHHGQLKVASVNTNAINMTFTPSFTTVISTNGAGSTNNGVVTHLMWPTDHVGWRLQVQTIALTNGIVDTNWTTVANSTFTNDMTFTNIVNSSSTGGQLFRLIFP